MDQPPLVSLHTVPHTLSLHFWQKKRGHKVRHNCLSALGRLVQAARMGFLRELVNDTRLLAYFLTCCMKIRAKGLEGIK